MSTAEAVLFAACYVFITAALAFGVLAFSTDYFAWLLPCGQAVVGAISAGYYGDKVHRASPAGRKS